MNVASILRRAPAATTLVVVAAIAALAAATSPTIRAGRGPVDRVLRHDASASLGARSAPSDEEIAALLDGLDDDDRVTILSFGAAVEVLVDGRKPSELRSASIRFQSDPHGSSLGRALNAAAS